MAAGRCRPLPRYFSERSATLISDVGSDPTRSHASAEHSQWSTRTSMVHALRLPKANRWQDFVFIYSPLLRHWIDARQVPKSAQDDVLQEALRSIFVGIGDFRRRKFEKGSFRGWLRTIVNRRVADYFRLASKSKTAPMGLVMDVENRPQRDPAELAAEEIALRELEARALHLIRESTAEKTWQMFWLSVVEQVPTSEIAEQFGVTTAAVRVAKSRVLMRLRKLFVDAARESE
ncbi:MAG: sigma-70 family RNA polymerase sigma factor [Rubripirellula sp.]|nr:sigma-70 family RNA polymerase sigma factor [Rubripirellula sp.]